MLAEQFPLDRAEDDLYVFDAATGRELDNRSFHDEVDEGGGLSELR